MSTTIPTFSLGQSAGATQMNLAFSELQAQGTSILQTLAKIQLTTLVDYQRRLDALNARRQRAARVMKPGITGFVVSDFASIDQGRTTATVRVDTASVTLRERSTPDQVIIISTTFTSSGGTVQSIDNNNTLFSVYNTTSKPTGTFVLTLASIMDISLLTIDVAAMASSPSIAISISENGLTWVPANKVLLSGYRLNAWLPETPTKYIQIVIEPSHPDDLGGSTYTFGITDLAGTTVDYNLISDVFFDEQVVPVRSNQIQLVADVSSGLTYYLSLVGSGGAYSAAVDPNTPISLPGVSVVRWAGGMDTSGVLLMTLPTTTDPATVSVFGPSGSLPVVPGLSPLDPGIVQLAHPHASLVGTTITVLPVPISTGDEYVVTYLAGPTELVATLRVHLATQDSTLTPIFTGAYLEDLPNVY